MSSRSAISNSFSVNTIEDGISSAIVELSQGVILYSANSSGASTSEQSFDITYVLKVGNESIASGYITDVSISQLSGVTVSLKTNIGCRITCANNASINGVIKVTMTGTHNGTTHSATSSITIGPNKKGEKGQQGTQGQRGEIGRFFYYGGVFNPSDSTTEFVINDAQAPYFKHTESGQARYDVYNPEENPQGGKLTMSQMWDSTQSWSVAPWRAMTNDFKYLITEAIFSNFAKFGSAIISGDWMISQHGTINGIASTNYEKFDPAYPNESVNGTHTVNGNTWTGYNFVPNYCVDLLDGTTYQHDAYVNGAIHAQSLSTEFLDINFGVDDEYYVNWDEDTGELMDSVFWNYRCVPSGSGASLDIFLPNDKFAYFGQRVLLYNTGLGFGTGQTVTIYSANATTDPLERVFRPLVGITLNPHSGTSTLANSFIPVKCISFVNGVIELVCVPAVDNDHDTMCDWAVVNIGTNYYRVEEYIIN